MKAALAATFQTAQGLMGVPYECILPTCLALDLVSFLHIVGSEDLEDL